MAKTTIKFKLEVISGAVCFQVLEQRELTRKDSTIKFLLVGTPATGPRLDLFTVTCTDYPDIDPNFTAIWLRGCVLMRDSYIVKRHIDYSIGEAETINSILLVLRAWAGVTNRSEYHTERVPYEEVPISEDGIYEF